MPGLKIVWRGGIAYAVGSVAGQRVRKSLGTRERGQAEELRAQFEARLWKRHTYGEGAVRTFEEAAMSYMDAGGEATYLTPLIARFRGRALAGIAPEEIRQAAREIYPDAKPATRNRQGIVPARAVINHGHGLGWCGPIRVASFDSPRSRPRKASDRQWLDGFLRQADRDALPHLAAAVLFMWQTGARVSEAARVLPEHIDLGARTVLLERTKTGEWETRHITRELMVRLANLVMTPGEPVFGYARRWGIYARMKAVCRRAGLPWRSPHEAGRHSYATNALAGGATIKQVMDGGGWKSARMLLETYVHAEDGGRAVARLFEEEIAPKLTQRNRVMAAKPRRSRRT